jgi:hypothetical protein
MNPLGNKLGKIGSSSENKRITQQSNLTLDDRLNSVFSNYEELIDIVSDCKKCTRRIRDRGQKRKSLLSASNRQQTTYNDVGAGYNNENYC